MANRESNPPLTNDPHFHIEYPTSPIGFTFPSRIFVNIPNRNFNTLPLAHLISTTGIKNLSSKRSNSAFGCLTPEA